MAMRYFYNGTCNEDCTEVTLENLTLFSNSTHEFPATMLLIINDRREGYFDAAAIDMFTLTVRVSQSLPALAGAIASVESLTLQKLQYFFSPVSLELGYMEAIASGAI